MRKKFICLMLCVFVTIFLCIIFIKPIFKGINYGLDLKGGFEVLYLVESLDNKKVSSNELTSTYKSVVNRIDTLGVSEPEISIEGDKIRIKLPGVNDENEARERLSTPAVLTFRNSRDELLMNANILSSPGASLDYDSTGLPVVALNIKDSDLFYKTTKKISESDDQLIVIWLDFEEGINSFVSEQSECGMNGNMKCISAATVTEAFSNNVIIKGSFSKEEASSLVDLINSGSLPTKLTEISTKTVDASFGSNTLNIAALAGIIALLFITFIMTLYYRLSGFISSVCLLIYSILVFLFFNLIDGVLTLTGIAALILGIGMAVDSSIVTLERIKEELRNKKSLSVAFKDGNKSSLISLIDANVTTFIAAIILFMFGESTVKGFATMLILTIFVTMFTMVIINRYVLRSFVKSKLFDNHITAFIGINKEVKKKNYVKHGLKYGLLVCIVLLIGFVSYIFRGANYGIDFKGGTSITIKSEEIIDEAKVQSIIKSYKVFSIDKISGNELMVKLSDSITNDEMKEIKSSLEELNYNTDISVISNIVKKDLTRNAIKAFIYATLGILLYITIRFTSSYAIASIVALVSDVIITIGLFLVLKIEINFIFIAAILTIIGYSINDTIVIFDMIRETLKKEYNNEVSTKEELINIANESIAKTLIRCILTSLTTISSVLILLILNASEIRTFNIALLIGLTAGTFSTLFLATRIWVIFTYKKISKPKKDDEEDDEAEEKLIKGINS